MDTGTGQLLKEMSWKQDYIGKLRTEAARNNMEKKLHII